VLLCDVLHGRSGASYKGVISLFGEHFVKTEIFERELGKALNDAYDKRLVGDYGIGLTVTKEEAKDLLETAQDFVQKLKNYLIPAERYLLLWAEKGEF